VITTELSFLRARHPLWPEDIPFAHLEETIREQDLAVFTHADDLNQGLHLLDSKGIHISPRWAERWDFNENLASIKGIKHFAASRGFTGPEINLAWLLNRHFPVIAMVSLPVLLSPRGVEYERASHLILDEFIA
jgi:hypothetical protein